ncbi:MAG: nucleotidyltransferase [Clostridia bacterium]|nr:nucleotidyltransferase [Clostridia bacterium]
MKEPILLIMAAGMGSRYGGLKQMDPIGPAGEVILHFSVYDAIRAGFKRVVFLIKHEIEEDFKRLVGDRVAGKIEVSYAFQELNKIPAPFTVPEGRVKPWGTSHALLCCKEFLDAPFIAINADDYYGVEAFQTAYDALIKMDNDTPEWMMVGYRLSNTTTANGYVSRGVCQVDANGFLTDVEERLHIVESSDGPLFTEDGTHYTLLPRDVTVSMNFWGLNKAFLKEIEDGFPAFLTKAIAENPLKGEYLLPRSINEALQAGRAKVRVLECGSRWFGVTYPEDRQGVVDAVKKMTDEGLYPTPLFG